MGSSAHPNAYVPEVGGLGSELPEAPRDKFFRKMREQPLVPIGKLGTFRNWRLRDLIAQI